MLSFLLRWPTHWCPVSGKQVRRQVAGVVVAAALSPLAAAVAQTPTPRAAEVITLDTLVERAGVYVLTFERRFSNVVTEERYVQESIARQGGSGDLAIKTPTGGGFGGTGLLPPARQRRELVSDFLLVKLPAEEHWLPFRDVFEVDHQRLRDREDRLSRLFLKPASTALEQARRIMDECARYNIGTLQRTMNLPVFALEDLRPSNQRRFGFSKGKLDTAVGPAAYVVEFREQLPPTLIRGEFGRELFSRG